MENQNYKNIADEKIASFDCTYTSNHIRMLKILLQYIPKQFQKYLIIYIKFMELQHAFTSPGTPPRYNTCECAEYNNSSSESFDFTSLIHELLPYCNSREEQQFRQIENMMNQFEQMKNMMEMLEMIKDMKEMFGGDEGGMDPEMLSGMLGSMGMPTGMMDGMDIANLFTK